MGDISTAPSGAESTPMSELPHLPPVAQGVLAISAVALAIVRLLTASRPFWAWEKVPVWVQKLLPALLMAVAALPTAIEHARSWLDILVGFVVTGAMWFTASRGDTRPAEPPAKKGGGDSNDDPDTTVSLMPDPVKLVAQDRSRLHNDVPDEPAEMRGWRHQDWRLQLVLGVLVACVLSCAVEKRLPCDESKLRAIDAEYSAKVIAECLPKYDSKEACPAWKPLQEEHSRQLKEACP